MTERLNIAVLLVFALAPLTNAASNPYWYDKTQTIANRQTMVHLFEWKWDDIANECENFLQRYGYGAVQVSPPMEHITVTQNNDLPWWVRYQPVSYQLYSRSGNPTQFRNMVERCNAVGVRIIVDVVLNHMVGVGQKKGVGGVGSSGPSDFDGRDGVETFAIYSRNDFNDAKCHGDIQGSDYQNSAANVKNCRLVGLLDLDQGSSYVRGKMKEYLEELIDIGVAGFRFDASKHMWPQDLQALLDSLKNLKADIFGSNQRPFVVHEVIDRGGEAVKWDDYISLGRYTDFNYGAPVSAAAKCQADWQNLATLGPGFGYGNGDDNDILAFIDNHDNQRDDNPYVVTYKNGDAYRLAVTFMLAWPYGYPRVMSSYYFNEHNQGPPNSGAGSGFATTSPSFNDDETCASSSGWVCEHRWPSIRRMALFRSAVQGTAASNIVVESQFVAFARTNKGYFVINNSGRRIQPDDTCRTVQTTLPAGHYCDVYEGDLQNNQCTGSNFNVGDDGRMVLTLPAGKVLAIHVNARVDGAPPTPTVPPSWQTTVIFLRRDTQPGQNMFVRGGNTQGNSCSVGPYMQEQDPCAISIAHNTTTPFVYAEYQMWSQNDNFLDFEGAEERQGTHDGRPAFGTPLAYSTNDANAVEYQPLNHYGPGYWMVQMKMDCSKTQNGWFELKGYEQPSPGWEPDVSQGSCGGSMGGQAPFRSNNHIGRCGGVNVFQWGSTSCTIDSM